MAVPTPAEQAIYSGGAREWEVLVQMSLIDAPYSGQWLDLFDGSSLDTDKWLAYIPEGWGAVTVENGHLLVTANTETSNGDIVKQPYPPFVVSRSGDGVPFPTQGQNFNHHFNISFPAIATYGVQYRIMAPDQVICEVEANEALGLNVKMDEQIVIAWGIDTGNHNFILSYDAIHGIYTLTRDGVFVASLYSWRQPLAVVIGNSAVDQGIVGKWTDIQVNSVWTQADADSYDDPTWVEYSPQPKFQEDGKWWAYLPYVIDGQIDVSRQNDVDMLRLTMQNLPVLPASDPSIQVGVYADAGFQGHEIRVKSRIGDTGGNWTSWRTIFRGIVDEPSGKIDGGVAEFNLQARDRWRRELFETRVIKSWGDYDEDVKGIVNHKSVKQIIDDLMAEALVPSGNWVFNVTDGTTALVPRTFNVMDQSCGSAIVELLEGMAWSWYVDHATGIIHFEPWPEIPVLLVYPSPGDTYTLDRHTLERIDWHRDAFSVVAQAIVGIQNTEQQVDIKLGWPPSPIPAGGRRDIFSSKVGQSWNDIENNDIPKRRWYMLNRNVGAIDVVATAHDWMHHEYYYILIIESVFLAPTKPVVWFLDGWAINFSGDDYQTTLHLVTPNMSGITTIIRDGMLGG